MGAGYGGGASVKHPRFEDVHFVSNTVDHAIWLQLAPRYWTGRRYPEGRGTTRPYPSDDVRFINCTFYRPARPSLLAGKNVGPVLFKNVKIGGVKIRNIDQLKRAGLDVSVPVKFEP